MSIFNKYLRRNNNHGIALIIVLLVTALLIALVFEFAYGTRVSLRAAENFRDSQRAYFLARAGINAFVKYRALRDQIPQGVFVEVPLISTGDTTVRIMWEDEKGKLSLNYIDREPVAGWIDKLFINQGIATDVYDRLKAKKKQELFDLVSELHTMMKDEDYRKVAHFLTPYYSDQSVNINTASVEVLMSLGCSESAAKTIVELRSRDDLTHHVDQVRSSCGIFSAISPKIEKPSFYKIYSHATVGGYTKQIETVIDLGASGTTTTVFTTVPIPKYWRVL